MNLNFLFFSWGSFYDPESKLTHYEICLGTAQGECDEINYLSVGLNTTYTFDDLKLHHKEEYYVTIKAINVVGLSTKSTSNGIKIDLTPPEPVKHISGSFSDFDEICYSPFDSCNEEIPGKLTTMYISFCIRDPQFKIKDRLSRVYTFVSHA